MVEEVPVGKNIGGDSAKFSAPPLKSPSNSGNCGILSSTLNSLFAWYPCGKLGLFKVVYVTVHMYIIINRVALAKQGDNALG